MHPPRCRSRSVGGAEGTRDPARGWQPASQRGSAWEDSRLPHPACACPVLGWVSPPPETPSAPAEDARGEKKLGIASHCGAVYSLHSITVRPIAFRRLASHHTTPWHVWHRFFCFSVVCRVCVHPGQSPHGTTFPRVFRSVCLAGAPVSMEVRCSVSSPVEMSLPLLRLS